LRLEKGSIDYFRKIILPLQGVHRIFSIRPKAMPLGWVILLFQSDLENPANLENRSLEKASSS